MLCGEALLVGRLEAKRVRPDVERDARAVDLVDQRLAVDEHADARELFSRCALHVEDDGGDALIEVDEPLRTVPREHCRASLARALRRLGARLAKLARAAQGLRLLVGVDARRIVRERGIGRDERDTHSRQGHEDRASTGGHHSQYTRTRDPMAESRRAHQCPKH